MTTLNMTKDAFGRIWFTSADCDTAIVVTREIGPGGVMWTARLHDMADGSWVECDLKRHSMISAADAAAGFWG